MKKTPKLLTANQAAERLRKPASRVDFGLASDDQVRYLKDGSGNFLGKPATRAVLSLSDIDRVRASITVSRLPCGLWVVTSVTSHLVHIDLDYPLSSSNGINPMVVDQCSAISDYVANDYLSLLV